MLTVVETPAFLRSAQAVWNADECQAFIDWIAVNPTSGDVIPGGSGLRKVRWSRQGTDKQGGSRVIYFVRNDRGEIVLLLVYAKSKMDNLSNEFLRRLKETFNGPRN